MNEGEGWMREVLRQEGQLATLALRRETRLAPASAGPAVAETVSDDLQIRASKYQPLVGLIVGALAAGIVWLAAQALPDSVAVLLGLSAALLATGAFHETGLAAAADSLGHRQSRERSLDALREGRVGVPGLLAVGMLLALKVAVLSSVGPAAGTLLIAGHVLSRLAVVHVIATTRYARSLGARFVAPSVTPDGYRLALSLGLLALSGAMLVLGVGPAVLGLSILILLAQGVRRLCLARIGGYTGACLGAVQQVGELGFYLGAAFML